jgi:hypothetical protein
MDLLLVHSFFSTYTSRFPSHTLGRMVTKLKDNHPYRLQFPAALVSIPHPFLSRNHAAGAGARNGVKFCVPVAKSVEM